MFATLGLHLRRLSSRRIIRLERIEPARIRKTLGFYVRSVSALLNAESCNIFVVDPDAAKAWVDIGTGVSGGEFSVPTKSTLIGDVIASGKSLLANDLAARDGGHREFDRQAGVETRNGAYAPVRSRYHDEVIGVIEVLNKKDGSAFSDADVLLLEDAAEGIQDLVDSVFLDQNVYGAADEVLHAGGPAILTVIGLMLLGSVVTLLLVAAWSVMPVINEAMSPSLAPFVPSAGR